MYICSFNVFVTYNIHTYIITYIYIINLHGDVDGLGQRHLEELLPHLVHVARLPAHLPPPTRYRPVTTPVADPLNSRVWPLCNRFVAVAKPWRLHGRRAAVARRVRCNGCCSCVAVAQPLHGRYAAIAWPLNSRCMAVKQPLQGRCVAAAWPLHSRCMAVTQPWPLHSRCMAVEEPLHMAVTQPLEGGGK